MPTQGSGVFYFWWVGSRGDKVSSKRVRRSRCQFCEPNKTYPTSPTSNQPLENGGHSRPARFVRQRLRTFQTYRCLPTYFRQVQTYQSTYWSTCFYAVTCLVKDSTGTVHNTKDLLTGTVVHQSTKLTLTQYSGKSDGQRMHSDRIQDDFAPKKEALQSGASVMDHGRLSATPL